MAFEKGIGIHLTDRQIIIAQVGRSGGTDFLYQKELPEGLISDSILKRPELLKSRVDAMLRDKALARLKGNVVLLVPDSRTFVATFVIGTKMKRKELEAEVLKRAQRQIPVPFKDAAVDLEYGASVQGKQSISAFVVERDVIKSLESSAQLFALPVIAMEDSNTAALRILNRHLDASVRDKHAKVVVDVGVHWVNLSLFNADGLAVFIRSMKIEYTSGKGKGEEKKLSATQIKEICDSIKQTVEFYRKVDRNPVSVFLTGTGGVSKELLSSSKKLLKGYPVARVSDIISLPDVTPAQSHLFCAAIGAAYRAAHPRKFYSIHNFKDAISYDG